MVNIPSNLQNLWNEVAKDGKIDKDDFEKLARQAVDFDKLKDKLQSGDISDDQKLEMMNAELDSQESAFLKVLEPAKEGMVLNVKNGSAPGTFDFIDQPQAEVKAADNPDVAETNVESTELNTAAVENEQPVAETAGDAPKTEVSDNGFDLPEIPHEEPKVPLLPIHQWSGYTPQVNQTFAQVFSVKSAGIPALNQSSGSTVAGSLGFNSVKELQATIGAKTDNKYGPETHTKTKAFISQQINSENRVEVLQQLKTLVSDLASKSVLGRDPELAAMTTLIDQKINALSTTNVIKQYDTNVRAILSQTDPKSAESLAQAKTKLMEEFNKLPDALKGSPQADIIHTSAMTKVFKATKAQMINEANTAVDGAVNDALKTGDAGKLPEAKSAAEAAAGKLTALEADPDFQKAKSVLANSDPNEAAMTPDNIKAALTGKVDKASALITEVTGLIDKKGWNAEERTKADSLIAELPEGDFKTKFQAAIDANTEKAQLREKNMGNMKTALSGLHDVIGNGFWNLENSDGTKAMFQLAAKQGLLDDAITKMTVDDQKEAIKILTSGIKSGKPGKGDDFNLAIAQKIYQNLSQSMNVDGDFDKKKVLPKLQQEAPKDFESFNIDENTFVKGMKFSIGIGRPGAEEEAAVTMGRAIINGEVPASLLTKFDQWELDELVKFMGEKGSKEDKAALLKTIAGAYNEGKAVNIDNLDRKDKAAVIKNVLESPERSETKLKELVKKSGDKTIYETVRKQDLSDHHLAVLAKHTDGDDMADEPDVAAKMLVAMIKTFNEQEGKGDITLKDINDFISEIDKDWWEDDDTMEKVLNSLGDGPESAYERFKRLAPSALDKIRNIAD